MSKKENLFTFLQDFVKYFSVYIRILMPVYILEYFLLVLYQYCHCDDLTAIAPKF